MSLIIDQDNYEYVLSALGYPAVDHSELSSVVTEEAVKGFCILPSLKEYFRWFPIYERQSIAVAGGTTGGVEYPDSYTYSIAHHAFTSDTDSKDVSYAFQGNPFVTQKYYSNASTGMFGSRFNYGFDSIGTTLRNSDDIVRNSNRVVRVNTDEQNRKIEYYVNESGYIELTWAKWSDDFSKVPWNRQREVLELSKAELLLWTAGVLSQMNPEFPSEFNYDDMQTRGEDIKEAITEKWKGFTKAVAIK